jgi:hypothetical protein
MEMQHIDCWMTPHQLVVWAKKKLNIRKSNSHMAYKDIRLIMRWIGYYSYDTVWVDGGKPRLGRIAIDNMLFTTMMVFPAYYRRYELTQRN